LPYHCGKTHTKQQRQVDRFPLHVADDRHQQFQNNDGVEQLLYSKYRRVIREVISDILYCKKKREDRDNDEQNGYCTVKH
jgi:hypothetical protein